MKLQYLGTAAAEGIPAVFCACATCTRARQKGGRNIRTRSQAVVDDRLLIDFPADTYLHSLQHGIDLMGIRHCLITHIHEDHLYPAEFGNLKPHLSYPPQGWEGLTVWGSPDVSQALRAQAEICGGRLELRVPEPFVPTAVGAYTVTALRANHGTPNPCIYLISDGTKTLLYAHDTDVFPEETWAYLEKARPRLELVSLDCTEGSHEELGYVGHMCLGRARRCRQRLKELGAADDATRFVLNHFSHNGQDACYDDLLPLATAEGFLLSWDGLTLEF